MKGKVFQRCKESFKCENCGTAVEGNGYTNHCPSCLWSKHVDIQPGDRSETCGGLMKPVSALKKGDDVYLAQVCERCNFERAARTVADDSFEAILEIMSGKVGSSQ